MTVYLKLAGPNTKGLNPKGCYTKGWTDPFYSGCGEDIIRSDAWIGMRLDNYIVVDCDNADAKEAWLQHIGLPLQHTLVRKTPNGWHFIYKRGVDSYGVKARVPWFLPKVDLKVGPGHLIVVHAPGYETAFGSFDTVEPFDLAWLPAVMETAKPVEEWDEVPEGSGDSFMISVAGKMRSWGMSERLVAACLRRLNDTVMPTAPMPSKSIARIARSASRYEPDERTTIECLKCGAEMEVR